MNLRRGVLSYPVDSGPHERFSLWKFLFFEWNSVFKTGLLRACLRFRLDNIPVAHKFCPSKPFRLRSSLTSAKSLQAKFTNLNCNRLKLLPCFAKVVYSSFYKKHWSLSESNLTVSNVILWNFDSHQYCATQLKPDLSV
jgi:hypothetical protein